MKTSKSFMVLYVSSQPCRARVVLLGDQFKGKTIDVEVHTCQPPEGFGRRNLAEPAAILIAQEAVSLC